MFLVQTETKRRRFHEIPPFEKYFEKLRFGGVGLMCTVSLAGQI